jgi:hypothetical protein
VSVVQLVVNTNTVLNLLNHMIKSNHIICLLLNMSLKLIIWLKCSKTKTPLIPVLNLNHLITKKYLPPSTRKRNAQRLNQWKAKRIEAVVYTKVNTEAQTENRNTQIDETTQTDQQSNHDQIHGRIQDYKFLPGMYGHRTNVPFSRASGFYCATIFCRRQLPTLW